MNKLFAVILSIMLLLPVSSFNASAELINIYYGDYDESLFIDYIDVPVVAAINEKSGLVGRVRIGLLNTKSNMIVLDRRTDVERSTLISILDAVRYANSYTGEVHDYFVAFDLKSDSVKGQSTGAAIALGMIALAENMDYDEDYIVTGSLDEAGNIKDTGGLKIKILSVSNSPSSSLIIGRGQSMMTIYDNYGGKVLVDQLNLTEFSKNLGVDLIESQNMEQAIGRIIKEKL